MTEKGLLPEDDSPIRLVPAAVRDVWKSRGGSMSERDRAAWAEFLKSPEGKQWLKERRGRDH